MLLNYTVGELYLKLVVSPLWISSDSVINVIKSFPVPVGRAPAPRLVRAAARISEIASTYIPYFVVVMASYTTTSFSVTLAQKET